MNGKKIIFIGIILALAGVGTYVYTNNNQSSKQTKPQSATATDNSTSTSPGGVPGGASGSSSPTTSNQLVFRVPEAKLEISLPASLADLTYSITGASDGSQLIGFSTKALTASIPACNAQRPGGALTTLKRGNGSYQPPANPADGGLIYQGSDFYIAYLLPNGPCAQRLTVDQQRLLDSQAQEFYNAVHSARPITN